VHRARLPIAAAAAVSLAVAAPPAVAQDEVPVIARGQFDARLVVSGTGTIDRRRWRLSPSCLGAACTSIRLNARRSDGVTETVTLTRDRGAYRGRLRTRAVCRGRLAKSTGSLSIAIRVTRTVQRRMRTGRETIIQEVAGELRVRSAAGACQAGRALGRVVRVVAKRIDLPAAPRAGFRLTPSGSSIGAGTNIVRFTDNSRPAEDIRTWSWSFGDPASGSANQATGPSVEHTFATAGSYRVTLTISDGFGQVASASKTVVVHP
jgi:hypothetical protein